MSPLSTRDKTTDSINDAHCDPILLQIAYDSTNDLSWTVTTVSLTYGVKGAYHGTLLNFMQSSFVLIGLSYIIEIIYSNNRTDVCIEVVTLTSYWAPLLEGEFKKLYYQQLRKVLQESIKKKVIYPDKNDIYNALHFTSFKDTKVVIIGQDPYHGSGQADGVCFC